MVKIVCPKCNSESSFFLKDPSFNGPYRCWKCKEVFRIKIENNAVQSFGPLTPEEVQAIEAQRTRSRQQQR